LALFFAGLTHGHYTPDLFQYRIGSDQYQFCRKFWQIKPENICLLHLYQPSRQFDRTISGKPFSARCETGFERATGILKKAG
jgi:hypothetical protein